jgi:hypothetical protein
MRGAVLSLSQYAFMAWCSVKKWHRDNFTFPSNASLYMVRKEGTIIIDYTVQ